MLIQKILRKLLDFLSALSSKNLRALAKMPTEYPYRCHTSFNHSK